MSLLKSFNLMTNISISIIHQRLYLKTETQSREYIIATSKHGPGEEKNSYCTPRGQHLIRAKIGTGQPLGQIFKRRRPTGTVFSADINDLNGGDWVLTRILWLSGTEIGKNRLGNVDSMQRYIYIHG
ncbi:MAG TPA: L,D-transpeptidase, partial [Gammaproteobacteria bacterium]|nr:L,D-transpeptidase [Gammaproteobacteria bacterium]